jgi:hypothetical protein
MLNEAVSGWCELESPVVHVVPRTHDIAGGVKHC